MTKQCFSLLLMAISTGSAFAGVTISAPTNGANVSSLVQFVASATTSCPKGVAAMGIYPSPYNLAYKVGGAKLNTELSLNPGTYNVVVQEWDNCGGNSTANVKITVGSGGQGWVNVSAPANNSNDAQQVQYVASSGTGCSKGVAAMGVYSAPGNLIYQHSGSSLNAVLNFSPGTYNTTVQEWDNCGGSAKTNVTINVGGGGGGGGGNGNNFYNLQADGHWQGFGMLPPNYNPCGNCSPNVTWSMYPHVGSPSQDGNSSQFNVGGNQAFSDGFWNNHLIGDGGKIADPNHNIVPQYHNFVYDAYFYANNIGLSQALEFDINQFVGGQSFIWGTECRIAGGNQWDIWDNQGHKWRPTGVPCYPNNNAWNHVTIKVQRTSDGHLLFQSITLNGKTADLNIYEWPTSTSWYGITVNYQQDGNYRQQSYSIWVDKMTFSYW
jgi:major membrane immunogen (membrane-anchored lipoprotein)